MRKQNHYLQSLGKRLYVIRYKKKIVKDYGEFRNKDLARITLNKRVPVWDRNDYEVTIK